MKGFYWLLVMIVLVASASVEINIGSVQFNANITPVNEAEKDAIAVE